MICRNGVHASDGKGYSYFCRGWPSAYGGEICRIGRCGGIFCRNNYSMLAALRLRSLLASCGGVICRSFLFCDGMICRLWWGERSVCIFSKRKYIVSFTEQIREDRVFCCGGKSRKWGYSGMICRFNPKVKYEKSFFGGMICRFFGYGGGKSRFYPHNLVDKVDKALMYKVESYQQPVDNYYKRLFFICKTGIYRQKYPQ